VPPRKDKNKDDGSGLFDRNEFLQWRYSKGSNHGGILLGSERGDLTGNPPLELDDATGSICETCQLQDSCPVPQLADYLASKGAEVIVTQCKSFKSNGEELDEDEEDDEEE